MFLCHIFNKMDKQKKNTYDQQNTLKRSEKQKQRFSYLERALDVILVVWLVTLKSPWTGIYIHRF